MGENTRPDAEVVAHRRVYKYPLELRSGWQTVDIPYGANIVHIHAQVIAGRDRPTIWAEVNTTAPMVQRTLGVFATGEDIPTGSRHLGTIHIDWTVWHVYEAPRHFDGAEA